MSAIDEITRDSWLNKTFPEWGTWLTEEIAQAKVPEKTLSMCGWATWAFGSNQITAPMLSLICGTKQENKPLVLVI